MTIQNLVSFYDSYLKSAPNPGSGFSNPSFKSSLNEKVNGIDTFWKSQDLIQQKRAEMLKDAGNKYAANNQHKKAIQLYKRAIEIKPDYADVYFNLASSYKDIGDHNNAIQTYKNLLNLSPNDIEGLTYLGQCYKDISQFNEATTYFNKALIIDPKYDLANRLLKENANLKLSKANPELARQQREFHAYDNINKALNLVYKYAPKELTRNLNEISCSFNITGALSGHQNIAQYENQNKKIVVTDKYIWAAPEVIAAYLVHEAVHAKDRDSKTSIKEEQDAYREAVIFWINHNNGIKDPEMDYARSLFLINPANLDKKVAEVYSSRDNAIPEFSPNHGLSAFSLKSIQNNFTKIKGIFQRGLSLENSENSAQLNYDQGLLFNNYR